MKNIFRFLLFQFILALCQYKANLRHRLYKQLIGYIWFTIKRNVCVKLSTYYVNKLENAFANLIGEF